MRWKVSEHASQNDGLTAGVDKKELWADLCPDDDMLTMFICNPAGMINGVVSFELKSKLFPCYYLTLRYDYYMVYKYKVLLDLWSVICLLSPNSFRMDNSNSACNAMSV